MTEPVDIGAGRSPVGRLLLWSVAAAAALTAHAGLAALVMYRPPGTAFEAAAPAAIMIELAPAPVAPEADKEQIAEHTFEAPEVPAAPPETPEPPTPEARQRPPATALPPEVAPPDAVELPSAELPPPVRPPPAPVAEVAAPRPVARPESLTVPEAPEPQQLERAQAASEQAQDAARQAQVQAPPAEIAAAPQSSRGLSGSMSPARWRSQLLAHLERGKRYPLQARRRGMEGLAEVRIEMDERGNVLSVQLARSTGHSALDEEVLAMVRRASPLPPPPSGVHLEISAPVLFQLP